MAALHPGKVVNLKWWFGFPLLALALVAPSRVDAGEESLALFSPDRNLEVRFLLEQGTPRFAVRVGGEPLLGPSPLGFRFQDAPPLLTGLRLVDSQRSTFDETWEPIWGTDESIRNNYRELAVTLAEEESPFRRLTLVFRAFNDGIAFRYLFPEQPALREFQILAEETGFCFVGDFGAWWIPADYDSYELLHRHSPVSELAAANTPVTLETDRGVVLCLHEADLTDYAGMTLVNAATSGRGAAVSPDSLAGQTLLCELVPWPDEVKVKGSTPFRTPWRTIQIAPDAARLAESHLLLNLNEPCRIADTSWIQPLKYVGIWWGMHIGKWTWYEGPQHGATTENARRYIDFAAAHGIPALLIEGWNKGWESWLSGLCVQDYLTPCADFDLAAVVAYGRARGVEIIGHHESGGNVPHYEKQIDDAFAYYRRLGIRAVKTGYAGPIVPAGQHHHGQWMVRHYRMVVEKAAEYGLMIDAHEPIKDTGIRRTWPNLMSREGGRGMEYNAWSASNPPEHATVLPFTRLLIGPMDFTPGIFDLTFDEYKPANRVCSTLARQLAYYVLLYSPLQMAADLVENYAGQPAFRFIAEVPVDWDETRFLAAEIGDYVAVARRRGTEWFVGAITDEVSRRLDLVFAFLDPSVEYVVQLYADAVDTDWDLNPAAIEIGTYRLNGGDTLQAVLSPAGGLAMRIVPAAQAARVSDVPVAELPALAEFNDIARERVEAYARIRRFAEPIRVQNPAVGCEIEVTFPCSPRYQAGGPAALIDGLRGTSAHERFWQGFEARDLEAVIDLGASRSLSQIGAGFMQKPAYWIFFPTEVSFAVSTDGTEYETVARFQLPPATPASDFAIETVTHGASGREARFVRVRARNVGQCPFWHQGAGGDAWIFADEIFVR